MIVQAGGPDSLGFEAIFGGGNLYWTLRKSALTWRDDPDAQEVRRAWRYVEARGAAFRKRRAYALLGNASEADLANSEAIYDVIGTNACQLGLALTFATLAERSATIGDRLPALAIAVAGALNAGFESSNPLGEKMVKVFSKSAPEALNRIADMNTPRGVEFRYFWLELLCLDGALAVLERETSISADTVRDLRDAARGHYFTYVIQAAVKRELQFVRSAAEQARVELLTSARVFGLLRSSVMAWFGVSDDEFDRWASFFAPEVSGEDVDEDLREEEEPLQREL